MILAVGVQAGWSYTMDVNLLASTLNTKRHGGSGIYAGKNGARVAVTPNEVGTQVHFAKVPFWSESPKALRRSYPPPVKRDLPSNSKNQSYSQKKLQFSRDYSLLKMSTKILEYPSDQIYEKIDGVVFKTELNYSVPNFESSASVRWSINKKFDSWAPRYRLFSFFGDRPFGGEGTATIAICGIAACRNESIESCGLIPNIDSSVKTTLHDVIININSKILTEDYIPITGDFNLEPLTIEKFQFSKQRIRNSDNSAEYKLNMSILQPVDNVLSFGIYKVPGKWN